MKYYEIDERTARAAQEVNSFNSYKANSATNSYKARVDEIYALGEASKQREYADAEYIDMLCDRYAKKYAEYINKSNRVESSCPSVMVSGAGNFPVRKKQKQNAMRDKLMQEYEYFGKLEEKIRKAGVEYVTKSSDPKVLEKIQNEIDDLKQSQELMKLANKHYAKHKSLDDFIEYPEHIRSQLTASMSRSWRSDPKPFESYALQNNNANIKRLEKRLAEITSLKEASEQVEEALHSDYFEITVDKDDMRIRLIFDGKPSDEERKILKSNGFIWSPKNTAWQRQYTANAVTSTKRIIQKFKEINE